MIMVKKKKKVDKNKKLKFIRLGWEILHHKFLYYEGTKYGLKPISDSEYDEIEDKYRALGEELNMEPRAADLVGFDYELGVGAKGMIAQHMIATKGKIPVTKLVIREEAKKVIKKVNVFFKTLQEVMEEVGIDETEQKKIRIRMKKKFN